jgi:hypothetical protein
MLRPPPPDGALDAIRKEIAAFTKQAAAGSPDVCLRREQEGVRLRLNQIEFLLEGFDAKTREGVRVTALSRLNAALDLILQHLQGLSCPHPAARAKAAPNYAKPGMLAKPKVYEVLTTPPTPVPPVPSESSTAQ